MSENDKPVLIYATFPSLENAETVGGSLVDRRLAACVNIIPGMTAIYMWQGRQHRDTETVMIIKTHSGRTNDVVAAVRAQHPYDNPALVVLPVTGGSPDFLRWIGESVSGTP